MTVSVCRLPVVRIKQASSIDRCSDVELPLAIDTFLYRYYHRLIRTPEKCREKLVPGREAIVNVRITVCHHERRISSVPQRCPSILPKVQFPLPKRPQPLRSCVIIVTTSPRTSTTRVTMVIVVEFR
jgi:hypothetical protein